MRKSFSMSKNGLYLLMAACIMSSMLPPALYLSVAVISMVVILLHTGKLHLPKLWIYWEIIYLVAIGINCLYSEYSSTSMSFFRNTFTHVIIASVFVCSIRSREDFLDVMRAFMYIGVIASLVVVFKERSSLLYSPLGLDTFGGGNIPFTYILIPASASCIYLIMEDRKRIYFAVIAFLLIISLLTTSRKAILLPIVFYVIYSLFHFKKSFGKTIGYIVLGGLLVAAIFVLFFRQGELSSFAAGRLTSLLDFFAEGEGDESLAIREGLIQRGMDYISERPLLGYGMGTYSDVTGSEVYSHNNYIETLFGGGIVMLVIYYSIYLICIFKLWKRKDSVSHFLIAMCFVYLLSDYGTVSYFVYPQLFMLIMATLVSEKAFEPITS